MGSSFSLPQAYMGYVGFVKFSPDNTAIASPLTDDILVRATSADVSLKQDISLPDVIDSRYDRTVYQLGPRLVDGTVAFPAVYDLDVANQNIVDILYKLAVIRRDTDGLLNPSTLHVKYASDVPESFQKSRFKYTGNIVNTWKFAVAAEGIVEIETGLMGVDRILNDEDITNIPPSQTELTNTRIVTWNDARVEISPNSGSLTQLIGGEYIRSFEANINNNAERFYTLNTDLSPQSIAPKKRDVSGNVVLMGRHDSLGSHAETNQERCAEIIQVRFGYQVNITGSGEEAECFSSFGVQLPNCVFEIETMSLTNELFETTVNWYSLPNAGTGVTDPLATSDFTAFEYDD